MNGNSRFVWHDLNTSDVEGAKKFYGELFNWKLDENKDGYSHIHANGKAIGGMRKQSGHEGPPHWLGYVGVEDVAAAAKMCTQHNGKVIVPPQTIDKAGTFSIISDPTGAVFSLWKGERAEDAVEPKGMPATHDFCWDELLSTDVDKALAFYSTVFGWKVEKVDMGPSGTYNLLKRPGMKDDNGRVKDAGGVWKSPAPVSFWSVYIAVANTDATLEKAKKMGGKVMMEATNVPNVGRFAAISDPQGAGFAVLQPMPM